MATIENFATVSYTSGGTAAVKTSNVAEIELNSSLGLSKTALGSSYSADTPITYVLSLTNDSASAITNIVISDDLGTFTPNTAELTPLTYKSPALLLVNGLDATASMTVNSETAGSVTFSIPSLAAGAAANIVYTAVPNEYAPLAVGEAITNTATLTSDSECASGTASTTLTALEEANVEVVKTMSPDTVICGETVTYTVRIYNYGNLDAENVRLSDTFTTVPDNITVTRDGVQLPSTGYTYTGGTLTVPPTAADGDTVPAASFVRDADSGAVNVTPGIVEYVITGTV